MQNLALAILDGNLTADPEIRRFENERSVTRFTMAANHEYGSSRDNSKKNAVSYIQIECWNKLAENCAQYLQKGSRITVTGDIRQDRWQDKNGQTRSTIKVVARNVRFDSSPRHDAEDSEEKAA